MVDMLGLLLAVTVTSVAADDGAAAPQLPKKAADFGVRQVAWMPLAVEQVENRSEDGTGEPGAGPERGTRLTGRMAVKWRQAQQYARGDR